MASSRASLRYTVRPVRKPKTREAWNMKNNQATNHDKLKTHIN
jgi:hypothetical protein